MSILHTIRFQAPAAAIYEVLVRGELFAKMSGAPAQIDAAPQGEISLFGGYISGRNLELIPNKKLVQTWRSKDWPEEIESTVSFALAEDQGTTTLSFEHKGFPEDMAEHLEKGWHEKYWNPIRKFVEAS
jgi:activator of HSP90 ATPase